MTAILSTVAVGAVLVAVLVLAIRSVRKNKHCSGDCSCCNKCEK